MRRKNLLASIATLAAAAIFLLAPGARADTISHYVIGGSSQAVTVTADGSGGFTLALGTGTPYTLSGSGIISEYGEADELAGYAITTSTTGTFGAEVGSTGVYNVVGSFTSTLTINDPDEIAGYFTGTITWDYVKDHGTPTIWGHVTINGVSYIVDIQLTAGSVPGGFFDTWVAQASNGDSFTSKISSGELDITPEPVSLLLMMFGFAIVGAAVVRRRKVLGDDQLPLAA